MLGEVFEKIFFFFFNIFLNIFLKLGEVFEKIYSCPSWVSFRGCICCVEDKVLTWQSPFNWQSAEDQLGFSAGPAQQALVSAKRCARFQVHKMGHGSSGGAGYINR